MTGSVTLTVKPEELNAQAEVVSARINGMKNRFQEMRSIISVGTRGYWIGAAGDAYREKYRSYEPDIEEILNRLSEYVTDLRQMAGVYQAVEREAVGISEELPADVIV